jgi:hypothetical protein
VAQRLVCDGKHGRQVVLSEERWHDLIHAYRRSVLLQLPAIDDAIRETLANPNFITLDHDDRWCFYKRCDFPAPYDKRFLRVVTWHPHRWIDRGRKKVLLGLKGDVIDIDLVDRPFPREKMWWPDPM